MEHDSANGTRPEAIVAGHICLDIIPELLSATPHFAPGRMLEAGPAIIATGGAVSNTGVALHRLGVATRLVGKIGDDLFGQAICRVIEGYGPGLSAGMIVARGESSSYTLIISSPGVDRMFIHNPGSNATFGVADVDMSAVGATRLFHFGYPPLMARMCRDGGAELAELLRRARAQGLTTSLDLSMPDTSSQIGQLDWRAILAAALPQVDLFLPSAEELLLMLRRAEFERLEIARRDNPMSDAIGDALVVELAEEALALGAKVVGLKLGHRGTYLRTAGTPAIDALGRARPADPSAWASRELWAPCYATKVAGTTGAGDATIAGFLMGLLRGMPPERALSAGCAVGACSVEAADALGGVRSWPETAHRLAAGWPRLPLAIKLPGWRWDAACEIWVGPNDPIGRARP
jgi:sugar/nucleoside kinase (ribokinase family)